MIPKRIHAIWLGSKAPPWPWLNTWKQQNPEWNWKLWRERDIRRFILRNREPFERLLERGVYDAASDIARVEILHRFGGVYVDADSIALRPLDGAYFLADGFFATQEIPPRLRWFVTNAFMGATPGHPILERYIEHIAKTRIECKHGDGLAFCCAWRTTGPEALTKLLRGTGATVLEPWAFFTKTITGEPIEGNGWGEHFWSSTGERSPEGWFPGAVSYQEAR